MTMIKIMELLENILEVLDKLYHATIDHATIGEENEIDEIEIETEIEDVYEIENHGKE